MLRGLALLIIIAACGTYGLLMAQRYVQRPKQLRAFHQALEGLTTEISYGGTPLPQAMQSACIGVEEQVTEFFSLTAGEIATGLPASKAWLESANKVRSNLCLNNEDWQVIQSLASGLGTTDKVEEKKKLQLCSMRLLAQEESALAEGTKLAKLWSYMGFLAGATIALIIL
jgi:stage III sporulation protein AB